jgi:D-amino-acid dehydrogenase
MAGQRVIIIGGGVVGVCCAEALQRRGVEARVLERGRIAGGCSYGNSGFIAPGHGPLNKPGLFEPAMASMVDPDAPFHVVPTTDARTLDWLRRFRDACAPGHYDHCVHALADLGRDMIDRFSDLVESNRLDCDYRVTGSDIVCWSQARLDFARREVRDLTKLGFPARALDAAEMRERQPALRDDAVGGAMLGEGASINPYRFVVQLAERLRERGCEIDEDAGACTPLVRGGRCVAVETSSGEMIEADAVILATGLTTPAIVEPLGVALPMTNATGYHTDIRTGRDLLPRVGVIADADVILTPIDDFVRVSGTVAIGPGADALRQRRMQVMLDRTFDFVPALCDGKIISRWEGHRPAAPDGLPVIGPAPSIDGLYLATAHARLGLSLGPATGDLVASMICGESSRADAASFRVDRF